MTRPLSLARLISLSLCACGGQAIPGAPIIECPPGDVCTPACGPGEDCSVTPPNGPDGGSTTDSGGTSPEASVGPDYPDGSVPPTSSTVTVLDYGVVDAKYSAALSSLIFASNQPTNALHIYNTTTTADQAVALPVAPVAVAVDASGLHAAVAYDAHVSWIDLASATITATCALSSDAFDIALSKEGVAYVMPRTDQWVSIHVLDASCTEQLAGGEVYAGSRLALHPSEMALFDADQGLSPSSVNRCDIESSPFDCEDALGGADWGTYEYCGELWMSADGERIYTGCGVTLRVPGDPGTELCSYGGTLDGVSSIQYLSEAPEAARVVLIPGNGYEYDPNDPSTQSDTVVRVHETDYLGFVSQFELPAFPLMGTSTAISHGRFVFATPTMDTIFAVVQADATSGALNDFAVVTMTP